MYAGGVTVESAKGECNLGQHEIAFLYDEVVRTCDNHVVYKTAAKEIAAKHGQSLTFMAKFDEREGNSCHIHLSLRGTDGETVFADDDREGGRSAVFEHFVAGIQTTMRELTLLYAPNVNSYKRFQPGSFAPTAIAWGTDNRTCALRVVGHGAGLRVENRVPGGDVNPYLAVAGDARRRAARHPGGARRWSRPSRATPTRPTRTACRRPSHEARDLFAARAFARAAFGDDVVDHYAHAADVELAAFNAAVTDWERVRGFERL